MSVSSSHNQLVLPAPLPSANETISEPIQIFIENTYVPSGAPPTTSSPKEQRSVNVGLVIDEVQGIQNVQNEVTVKQDLDNSVDNDIRQITSNLNLQSNDSDEDLVVDIVQNDDSNNDDGNLRLSDTDVVSLPIKYLKPEDLERHKKLLHHQCQSCYLENLAKKKGKEYVFRWFKFTLKPPYTIPHGNLVSAIWDTFHWTSFVKFGLKTA